MATKPLPSQEVLRQLLDYGPETGALTWRYRSSDFFQASKARSAEHIAAIWNKRYAGAPALNATNTGGHKSGILLGVPRLSHRVIWKLQYGDDPELIDHANGDRQDNRLKNLRSVSAKDNARNTKRRKNNQSGVMGVEYIHKGRKQPFWVVKICNQHVGVFQCFESAVAARKKAEIDMGFHKNHGRSS